jgi:hypothetical protein
MMALIGQSEKTEKVELPTGDSSFPAFSRLRLYGMLLSTKMRNAKRRQLIVIWETAPDSRPDVVEKAFAFLFQSGDFAVFSRRFDKPPVYANVPDNPKQSPSFP